MTPLPPPKARNSYQQRLKKAGATVAGLQAKVKYLKSKLTLEDYAKLASRTRKHEMENRDEKLNFALGLAGEAGETADYLKKVLFHGHDADPAKVKDELGDVLWYLSQYADAWGLNLEEIAWGNVRKLEARYPEGFSHEASRNRPELAAQSGLEQPTRKDDDGH